MSPGIDALAGMARVATAAPKVAEVAASTTKAVEAVSAVPKVVDVATAAPQALAGGLEAGLGDAHATLGNLAEINSNLANFKPGLPAELSHPVPGTLPESNTSPIASGSKPLEGAVNTADLGTKPVDGETMNLPEKNATSQDAELSGIEKATLDAAETIENQVGIKVEQWDNEHPQPDSNTDPEKFNDWVRERASAQTSAREDATVNAALQNWDKDNPAPDKSKDPKAFNEWVEKRAQTEQKLKKEVSGEEGDSKTKEQSGRRELSAAEIAERVKRLNELNIQIAELNDGIKNLRAKADKTPDDKIRLAAFTVSRDGKINEVRIIKAELGDAITSASPIKKIALISALITAAGVMMAAQASKG